MSVAAMGPPPESPRGLAPKATSPIPHRPILPLPKRRLLERLPPNIAETIKYPPASKTTPPLFHYPYVIREDTAKTNLPEAQHPSERERADEIERNYISRRNGEDVDSEEDEVAYRSRIYPRHVADPTGRSYRYVQKPEAKYSAPQPPASIASSADGYDSFENTNNKKKRKIPTPGDSNINGVHLLNDMASMGISGSDLNVSDDGDTVINVHHSSASINGLSGPGRGRYGRNRNGRSPLRNLSDVSSNWSNGRTLKQRQVGWTQPGENAGIISTAIANAGKTPLQPSKGQENGSLLQQGFKKSPPATTQFTFSCDTQIPGTVPWPGLSSSYLHQNSGATRGVSTHATQTSPNMQQNLSLPAVVAHAKQGLAVSLEPSSLQKQAAPKKPRRRQGKEHLIAARQRRQHQEYQNFQHPPAPEDTWICEFCEYERIFGTPPEALIKQYEIKDRRVRKQEAERRRLLEKAKMKGRKGKKGGKGSSKTTPTVNSQATNPQTATSMHNSQSQSQGTQSEEFYEDEYDEEDVQDDPFPSSPSASLVSHGKENIKPELSKSKSLRGGTGNENHIVV